MSRVRLRVRTDLEKIVILTNIEKRKWILTYDDDWNIYWANKRTIRLLFSPESPIRLQDNQLINHFPNHFELTRKDNLIKNLKRYRRELLHDGKLEQTGDVFDYVPCTYNLPTDMGIFFDEYRKRPRSTWIVKPSSLSQGQGIFLVNRFSQAKKWATTKSWFTSAGARDSYVLSRYIDNPLLIGGRKFDLRLYVLVVRYHPLRCFISKEGFCRFCIERYSNDRSQLNNMKMHLTNVAVQKGVAGYNTRNGGKFPLSALFLYLQAHRGIEETNKLFLEIEFVITHVLKAVQRVISSDRHCFELYGFDMLVDSDMHPWLIEVNGSPSLSSTTDNDRRMKCRVISDTLNIVCTEHFLNACKQAHGPYVPSQYKAASIPLPQHTGSFVLLYDELTATKA